MKLATLALALGAVAVTSLQPAFAAKDCNADYKAHMMRMSIYIDKTSGDALADAIRKSVDAYTACMAGDSFSPHGVWDQIEADMKAKAGK